MSKTYTVKLWDEDISEIPYPYEIQGPDGLSLFLNREEVEELITDLGEILKEGAYDGSDD